VKNLLELLKGIFRKVKSPRQLHIPKSLSGYEKIVRSVFSPININMKSKKLKSNTLRSPAGKDEVSVTRLEFTNADFCKNFSLQIQNPSIGRGNFGPGVLNGFDIYSTGSNIIFTPILKPNIPENSFQADIKIGFIAVKGEPLPAEFQYKVDQIIQKCRFYEDPNPREINLTGEKLI